MSRVFPRSRLIGLLALVLGSSVLIAPASADERAFPEFGLPFAAGQGTGSGGIHSDDGDSGVKNAIDLNPDDRTVRAPLAGTVRIQHCQDGDWVTVDHADGWRTGFYHMEDIQVGEGQQVEAGTVLGNIGNALPCGGSSSGAHVHFTLWRLDGLTAAGSGDWDGIPYRQLTAKGAIGEPVDGKVFGGWRFDESSEQYSGTATRERDGQVVQLPGSFDYEG